MNLNVHLKQSKNAKEGKSIKTWMAVILGILGIFVAFGCISQDKATDNGTLIKLIVPGDIPEMTLKSSINVSVPQNSTFNITSYQLKIVGITLHADSNSQPADNRSVGEDLKWEDEYGNKMQVSYLRYDTNEKFEDFFKKQIETCPRRKTNASRLAESVEIGCGSAGIGDYSIYAYQILKDSPDIEKVSLQFSRGNYFVAVIVNDNKDKSYNKTIQVAKLIESRLS